MFDVLVPIGFCLMWILRPLTPYSGAVFQKLVFRLDETSIFVFFAEAEATLPWHVFSRLLSSASSSSKNLWGSGFSKLQRQHHMNTYCVTEGCKFQDNLQ